jgi:AcrR family transcriptional regulator
MNHIAYGELSALAPAHRPNQRAMAKQRTREKVIAAAKRLFSERGYERSTIRDIAKEAGMSTGAVFASFTDKSDLFVEIAEAEQAELSRLMTAAAIGHAGRAALTAMLEAAAERQLRELALVQAVMSALWTPGLSEKVRRRLDRRPIAALLKGAIGEDLGLGDETVGLDPAVLAEILWDGYISMVRRAAANNLPLKTLKAQIGDLVATVLAGARRP